MDGDSTGSAGLGAADTSSATDHSRRLGVFDSIRVDAAQAAIIVALHVLEGCSRQEVQEARQQLEEGIAHLEAAREGERSSESVHGKDP